MGGSGEGGVGVRERREREREILPCGILRLPHPKTSLEVFL